MGSPRQDTDYRQLEVGTSRDGPRRLFSCARAFSDRTAYDRSPYKKRGRRVRFVAKKELQSGFPAVSRVLRVQRHALISRHGDFSTAMRRIERLGRSIRDGEGAVIFAEGTRSRDGSVRTFHSGAIRRLHSAQPLALVAVAIDGGWRFSRVVELSRLEPGHRYRVASVAVYSVVHTKRELLDQIADARETINTKINEWREAEFT